MEETHKSKDSDMERIVPPVDSKLDVIIERLDNLTSRVDIRIDGMCTRQDAIEKSVLSHEVAITRLQERQGFWATAQGVFTLTLSAIAAWLGGAFK